MLFNSGTEDNRVGGVLAAYANSYEAVSGYGGYIALGSGSRGKGVIIRSNSPGGDIRFLLGGPSLSNEKVNINADGLVKLRSGDIYMEDINSGVIMKSPNGQCWRLTVTNAGQPEFNSISCPN